jgi:hypothetical protein
MHDELQWGYPWIWHGNNNITRDNPRVFQRFHEYIRNNSGFTTPQELGAESWDEVVPINMRNVTTGKHWQGLRHRVYWSIRFIGYDTATWFASATKALIAANNGEAFSTYTNMRNFHGRLITPGYRIVSSSGVVSYKDDVGGMDWMEAGRYRSVTTLWTEDWFGETKASIWSYMANRLRAAAKLGGPDITFGGYIVLRGPTGTIMHGSSNILKKALSLVGAGAKVIDWYNFGPIQDSYSAIGMHEKNHSMFQYVAESNRMIADADDLLFAGTMPASDVALLYPRSSWIWDNQSWHSGCVHREASNCIYRILSPVCAATIGNVCGGYGARCAECLAHNGAELASAGCPAAKNESRIPLLYCTSLRPIGPDGNEAQGSYASDYMAAVFGLFRSLQQVANIQIDFLDEDDLTTEKLAAFKAVILTEPDIPQEGQAAVAAWLKGGGHLLTVSGAAAYDRYNQPCTVLSSVTGIREAVRPRTVWEHADELVLVANGTGDLGRLAVRAVRGRVDSALPSTARVVAKFTSDDSPAIVSVPAGTGLATHFAFLPGVWHPTNNPYHPQPHFNNLTNATDGSLPYLLRFLKDAGVQPPVEVSELQVETPLLTSPAGAVVTLLNWRESPVVSLAVRVRLDFPVESVTAVQSGAKLAFNCTAAGDAEWWVGFTTSLDAADFITLSAKRVDGVSIKTDDRDLLLDKNKSVDLDNGVVSLSFGLANQIFAFRFKTDDMVSSQAEDSTATDRERNVGYGAGKPWPKGRLFPFGTMEVYTNESMDRVRKDGFNMIQTCEFDNVSLVASFQHLIDRDLTSCVINCRWRYVVLFTRVTAMEETQRHES